MSNKRGSKLPQLFKFSTAPARRVGLRNLNKRGQFYLIASILIIIAVFSIVNIRIAPVQAAEIDLTGLVNELELETGYVVSHGVYNHRDDENMQVLMDKWLEDYFYYSKEEIEKGEFVFIYGDEDGANAAIYSNVDSSIISLDVTGQNTGGGITGFIVGDWNRKKEEISPRNDGKISVKLLDEHIYEFDLKEGENFFFVISKERDEGRVIVKEKSGVLVNEN